MDWRLTWTQALLVMRSAALVSARHSVLCTVSRVPKSKKPNMLCSARFFIGVLYHFIPSSALQACFCVAQPFLQMSR